MRKILETLLGFFARQIVKKYKPTIIGITGSYGKTSTRAAVFAVVSQKYKAYTPPKNLNDKLGLPLGIIGQDSPGSSLFGWLKVFWRIKMLLLFRMQYPEVLVLEYGIDRVGEMDELLAIAKPDIAVLTSVGISHYEFFLDQHTIEQEKAKLVLAVSKSESGKPSAVILNADNEIALRQQSKAHTHVLTYGRSGSVRFDEVKEVFNGDPHTEFIVHTPSRKFDVQMLALGSAHVSSCLASVAVAEVMNIETDLIQKGLSQYKPVPGRLQVIAGLRRSWILDDTYNAAPESMQEALALFARFPATHKIAVLGDMLELGTLSENAHKAVGEKVARLGVSHLVTVGPAGKIIAEASVLAGLPEEQVISYSYSTDAAEAVRELMREGSLVLVKGSQGVRMEHITKAIMAEPMRAGQLLCRQYGKWIQ